MGKRLYGLDVPRGFDMLLLLYGSTLFLSTSRLWLWSNSRRREKGRKNT